MNRRHQPATAHILIINPPDQVLVAGLRVPRKRDGGGGESVMRFFCVPGGGGGVWSCLQKEIRSNERLHTHTCQCVCVVASLNENGIALSAFFFSPVRPLPTTVVAQLPALTQSRYALLLFPLDCRDKSFLFSSAGLVFCWEAV